ncbi:hypothetical protein [Actinoallomurus acaciae]|uniref:Uncharacterized protein n=1 Tax=Actinoallomurus acaciae TaxID=502577 RepID=A0ABV5YL32_9ACTN
MRTTYKTASTTARREGRPHALPSRPDLRLHALTPDDVHVQVLHGAIDSDVLTAVTKQGLEPAGNHDGGCVA